MVDILWMNWYFFEPSVQVSELDFSFSIADSTLRLAKTMETLEETQRQLWQRSIQVQGLS